MRKLVMFNLATLDGFFAGPNGEIDWHRVDEEFNEFAIDQINSADGLVFGRVTYQLMAGYWPTPEAIKDDPIVAEKMNSVPKIVFSKTLDSAEWSNTRLVKGDAAQEIARLKAEPGKDLFIFGSGNLAGTLTQAGLIDEYRIMVVPVVLGKGLPLFQCVDHQLNLRLLDVRTFGNGNVLLSYVPEGS